MEDKRKFTRFDSDLDAFQCCKALGGVVEKIKSRIKDLSREGMRLLTDNDLPKGTSVELEIDIPGDNMPVFAFSEVMWSKKSGNNHEAGLRFTKIEPLDRSKLLDYAYAAWRKLIK